MEIGSGNGYPASALSNFAPYKFIFDGVECNSMEGLLQSFKFKDFEIQKEICKLVGKQAKFKGKKKKWFKTQTLYWNNVEYKRDSDEYQELLDRAFNSLFENDKFKNALKSTNNAVLKHSIGKTRKNETVLTTSEFISRLNRLRKEIKDN